MSFSSSASSSSPSKESSIIKGNKYYCFFSCHQQRSSNIMLMLLFLMGAFLGYICWIVGVIFLILAIRSGIRWIKYSRHWLNALHNADYFSTTVQGRVIEATKSIHPITHNITYQASFEYDNKLDDNNNVNNNNDNDNIDYKDYGICENASFNHTTNTTNTNTTIQKQLTSYLDSQWLYEYQTHHAVIKQAGKAIFEVKVLDDHPNSGIPSDLFYHKIADCTLWSKYVDPTIACVGIHIYVVGCIIYSWIHTMENANSNNGTSYEYWCFLILSLVIAPTLMIPYLLKEQTQIHQHRIQQLQTDPILLVSELDYMRRLWNAIGCTWTKKLHLFLFVIGLLQLLWTTKYLSMVAFVAVWFGTLATGIIPIQRELLEKYRNHDKACTINGQIIIATNNNNSRREGERRRGRKNREISIRYSMTTNNNNDDAEQEDIDAESNLTTVVVTVEKQYLVTQELYETFTNEESSTTIPIRILNDYPCSGIPVDKLVHDIVSSWTMLGIQCLFWLSLLMYLFGCWSVLIDDDPYYYFWDIEDYLAWFCYIMIGPMLMVPQASTWHCIRYQKLVDEYLFKGKIV